MTLLLGAGTEWHKKENVADLRYIGQALFQAC